jgi:hypothetical protein
MEKDYCPAFVAGFESAQGIDRKSIGWRSMSPPHSIFDANWNYRGNSIGFPLMGELPHP